CVEPTTRPNCGPQQLTISSPGVAGSEVMKGQTKPSQKWAYVKAVKIDGVPGLVASGFYPE
ncbi:MAG TPA: hypothetical protein VMM27_14285, partial [Casimicrobiaceae bacterium]|nr:hypothetical protein [Casimicrobiaceae bacterium]